jgi:riboflavin kinase/FMN adenylyltransferase
MVKSEREESITRDAVLTVGTFDGIHVGHRKVLDKVIQRACQRDLNSLILTFDAHPLSVLRPSEVPGLLTNLDEKLKLISQLSIDYVEILPFTREFSQLSPGEFVRQILMDRYGLKELVIGYDHGFGRDREGSVPMLEALAREMAFDLSVVPPVSLDGKPVSSTRIRKKIAIADFDYVTRALGRHYSIEAFVKKGDGRGRTIGFPTANLEVIGRGKLVPPSGVYAVRGWIKGERYSGMMHQGERPTFSGAEPSLEVHLIDFDGDLLGERIEVEYHHHIREIRRFESEDELRKQLEKDRDHVKKLDPGE